MAGRRAKRIAVLAICLAVLMVLPWIYLSGSAMRSGWRRDASSIDGVKILPARSRGDRLPTIVMIGCLGDLGFALIHKLTEPKTYKIICIDSYANSFPQLWRPFISSPQPPPSSPYFTFINASLDGDKIGSYISEILSQPTAKIVGVVSTLLYPTLSWPSEVCAVVPHLCERSYVGSTASILDSLNSVPNPPWIVATSSRFEPDDVLGHIKRKAEDLFRRNAKKGTMILRMDEIYGARKGAHWEDQDRLIPQLVHNAIRGTTITIHEDWDDPQGVHLLHINDAVRAVLRSISFLEKNKKANVPINMTLNVIGSTEEGIRMKRLVWNIMKRTRSLSTLFVLPPIKQGFWRDDPSIEIQSAAMVLGINPKVPWEQGIADYIEWLQAQTVQYLRQSQSVYGCSIITLPDPSVAFLRKRYLTAAMQFEVMKPNKTDSRNWGDLRYQVHVDGIKMEEGGLANSRKPICGNADGRKRIVQLPFCTLLDQALEFVNGGFVIHQKWIEDQCDQGAKVYDLPVCEFDCNHPTICIQTGRCRCVNQGRCPSSRFQGFPSLSESVKGVEEGNLQSLMPLVMSRLGRKVISMEFTPFLNQSYIVPHHGDGIEVGFGNACQLKSTAKELLASFKSSGNLANKDSARYWIGPEPECNLPMYLNIIHKEYKNERLGRDLRMIWILARDGGRCEVDTLDFLRKEGGDKGWLLASGQFVLSANGDSDTNCWNPNVDVIIPTQSFQPSNFLTPQGEPLHNRQPSVYLAANPHSHYLRDRLFGMATKKLIGRDPLDRQLLQPTIEVISPVFHSANKRDWRELGEHRFCLAPRGWVGWSYRLFEIFAVGCIPVIMSDYTVYPWQQHILDWTRFAIFIRESEISILFEILSTIPHHELEELEWGRKIVRRSMLYGPGGYPFPRFSPEDMTIMEFALQRKRISVTKLWGKEYY